MTQKIYKIFVIVPICFMQIKESTGRGIKLTEDLLLSNESLNIRQYLHADLRDYAGRGDFNSIVNKGSTFAYTIRDVQLESLEHDVLIGQLNITLMQVAQFLSFLWMVRDNAAYPDCGYLTLYDQNAPVRVAKNYLGDHYSIAAGGYGEICSFTLDEIRSIRDMVSGTFKVDSVLAKAVVSQKLHHLIPNLPDQNRLMRCHDTISGARASTYLPQKIALYVTALETLFSTSASELTYRLSERAAFFLGSSAENRRELFENVKAAYSVRSSIVHGDTLSSKYQSWDALAAIATRCDELLRQALLKIYNSRFLAEIFCSKNREKIDTYFTQLIFSGGENLGLSI